MPDNVPKRNRSELDDSPPRADGDTDIVSLMKSLSSKMDLVTATVNANSDTMKEVDQRLTQKMNSLEQTMTENLKRIQTDTDARFLAFTEKINDRFTSLASVTQAACQDNDKFTKDLSTKMDCVQDLNETRLQKLERDLLRNELIITGVPYVANENVSDIIADICEAINCNINSGDLISVYRIPMAKNKSSRANGRWAAELSSPIVLKMVSDWGKNELLSTYFKKKNLNTSDIGFRSAARIYINESLTKYNRSIFKAASEAKKSKSIFKCFTRNGLVHIQISEGGKIIRVASPDHLNSILNQTASSQISTSLSTKSTNTSSSAANPNLSTNSSSSLSTNSTSISSSATNPNLSTNSSTQPKASDASSNSANANPTMNEPLTLSVHDGEMEQN